MPRRIVRVILSGGSRVIVVACILSSEVAVRVNVTDQTSNRTKRSGRDPGKKRYRREAAE